MKRREFLKTTKALVPLIALPYVNFGKVLVGDITYSIRAIDLVRESMVVDLLNQFAWNQFSTPPILQDWLKDPSVFKYEDALAFKASGIDVFALGHARPTRASSLEYFTQWNRFISYNSQYLMRIDKVEDMERANASNKTGVMLTYQDSRHFDTVDDVNLFHSLGQRLSQLTYNYANRLGTGGFEDVDKGLTEFGFAVLKRMNEVGMAIDVSHSSDQTTLQAIEASSKPVIITHANCRSLIPGHPRAKTDDMIKKLAAKGGVMGIPEIRFMVRGEEPVTVEHFLDHYDYLIKLVGDDHAAIGTDFDLETEDNPLYLEKRKKMFKETDPERARKYRMHTNDQFLVGIEGIDHPRRTYDIVEGFIRRNYSDTTIRKILGGNFTRAAKQIWV
ncbi:MAG: membrane dipeptidase [Cyclobacteriaceae bacterium]|nr:membrane dipeptidase [Cyclobacteriaceae bacterium]